VKISGKSKKKHLTDLTKSRLERKFDRGKRRRRKKYEVMEGGGK